MKNSIIFLLATIILLNCSPGIKVTNSWKDPAPDTAGKKYRAIFITALTDNQFARNTMEENLAEAAEARGIQPHEVSRVNANILPAKDPIKRRDSSEGKRIEQRRHIYSCPHQQGRQGSVRPGRSQYFPVIRLVRELWRLLCTIAGPIYTPGYYTNDKTYYLEATSSMHVRKRFCGLFEQKRITLPVLKSFVRSIRKP
jgi:hypothetical protein